MKDMTEKELREKVTIRRMQQGCYKVTINFRGREYSCQSHNSLAWDDLGDDVHRSYYKTDKQCLEAFYEECKRKNDL